jgi:hypothetical protein
MMLVGYLVNGSVNTLTCYNHCDFIFRPFLVEVHIYPTEYKTNHNIKTAVNTRNSRMRQRFQYFNMLSGAFLTLCCGYHYRDDCLPVALVSVRNFTRLRAARISIPAD